MCTPIQPKLRGRANSGSPRAISAHNFKLAVLMLAVVATVVHCAAPPFSAQTMPAAGTSATAAAQNKAVSAKSKAKSPSKAQPVVATPAPAVTPTVTQPAWPVNDKSTPANVTWDSRGLRIEAANSSLKEILDEVSTVTGAKIQGSVTDHRIFGTYGPGPARDILAQLLQGFGYNILMIGDQGQGAPRQIVLSSRNATTSSAGSSAAEKAAAESDDDDDDDDAAQQAAPAPAQQSNPRAPQQPITREIHTQQPEQQPDQQQSQDQDNSQQN
jgi:hypothetical protein